MPPLRGDLLLDTGDAERSIERLAPLFDTITAGFSQQLAEALSQLTELPPVELDVTTIEQSLAEAAQSGAGEIADALEAGGAAGAGELTDAIESAIDSADTTVEVDADTSQAEAALDDLQSKAEEAGSGLSDLAGGASAAGAAGDLATGSMAGLGSAIGEMSPRARNAVGIVGSLAVATGAMFNEAVDAQGAQQRFNSTLGDMAGEVENLRSIQGLNTDLSKLALTLGSDDDEVRNVSARLFELATASGKSREQASLYTQQMVALGARAVALNPMLGDVGTVTDSLSTALVRGGRFAAKFGLDLNQADINARALNQTGKTSTEQLTFVEKAMAGASLASEKYGDNLDKIIARGAENSITKLRSLKQTVLENIEALGMPLISPIFDLMEEGIPVAQEVGEAIAILARSGLPILTTGLRAVEPILRVAVDLLEAIPQPVLTAVIAFATLRGPLGSFGRLLETAGLQTTLFVRNTSAMPQSLGAAGVGLNKVGGFLSQNRQALVGAASAGLLAASSFGQIGKSTEGSVVGIGSMAAAGATLGSMIPGVGTAVGGLAGAAVGLGKALFGAGESSDEFKSRLANLAYEINGLSSKAALTTFAKQMKDDFYAFNFETGKVTVNIGNVRRELVEMGKTSPAAARNVLAGMQALVQQGLITQRQFDSLTAAVDRQSGAYARSTVRKQEAAAADRALVESEAAARQAAEEAQKAQEDYINSLANGVPTLSAFFDAAIGKVEDFKSANAPGELLKQFQDQLAGIEGWSGEVQRLMDAGLTSLARLVFEKGPIAGGALVGALQNAEPGVLQAMNDTASTIDQKLAGIAATLQNTWGPQFYSNAYPLGQQVPAGLAGGINDNAWQAYGAADAIAQGVTGRIQSAFQILSPSKVMMRMGRYVSEGFAMGMEAGAEQYVDRAGRRLALRPVGYAAEAAAGLSVGPISVGVSVPAPASWADMSAASRFGAAAGSAAGTAFRTEVLGKGKR